MYEQIRRNRRASWLLAGIVVFLLAALGYLIGAAMLGGNAGGLGLLGVFGVVAILWSVIGYYSGDKMVLAVSGAHRVTHDDEPQLYNIVEEMTIAAGLPQPPAVYVLDDQAINAFATGRDPKHASIAVTRGLLQRLDREELQGVVGHEMSHIRNYDIRFETLVGILVGMIALVADFFLRFSFWGGMGRRRGGSGDGEAGIIFAIAAIALAILAPLAAYAVQFAVSRRREYLADASAVELTRNPLGLARALNDIAGDPSRLRSANRATAHLFIANPLRGKKTKEVTGLFDTHPPIQQRIAVLLEMAHVGPEALIEARIRDQGPGGPPQGPSQAPPQPMSWPGGPFSGQAGPPPGPASGFVPGPPQGYAQPGAGPWAPGVPPSASVPGPSWPAAPPALGVGPAVAGTPPGGGGAATGPPAPPPEAGGATAETPATPPAEAPVDLGQAAPPEESPEEPVDLGQATPPESPEAPDDPPVAPPVT